MKITNPDIEAYSLKHSTPMPPIFDHLRDETFATLTAPNMQVGSLVGAFLQSMVKATHAKRILELGTYSGYSSLAMAMAMADDGTIITCDVNPRTTLVAQKYWEQHPCGKKITLKLAPAMETLPTLQPGFDLIFVDADKENYSNYWDLCIPLLRQGGVLLVDNVLWGGRVLEPKEKMDFDICRFNEKTIGDQRVQRVMLPLRDGILMAVKI